MLLTIFETIEKFYQTILSFIQRSLQALKRVALKNLGIISKTLLDTFQKACKVEANIFFIQGLLVNISNTPITLKQIIIWLLSLNILEIIYQSWLPSVVKLIRSEMNVRQIKKRSNSSYIVPKEKYNVTGARSLLNCRTKSYGAVHSGWWILSVTKRYNWRL